MKKGEIQGLMATVLLLLISVIALWLVFAPHVGENPDLQKELRTHGISLLVGILSSVLASFIFVWGRRTSEDSTREELLAAIKAATATALQVADRNQPDRIFAVEQDSPTVAFSEYWSPRIAASDQIWIEAEFATVFSIRIEEMMRLPAWKSAWKRKDCIHLHLLDPQIAGADVSKTLLTIQRLQKLSEVHKNEFASLVKIFFVSSRNLRGIELAHKHGVMVSFLNSGGKYADEYFAWRSDSSIYEQTVRRFTRLENMSDADVVIGDGHMSGKRIADVEKLLQERADDVKRVDKELRRAYDAHLRMIVPATPPEDA